MTDPLYELLAPDLNNAASSRPVPSVRDPVTSNYLDRLLTLPLSSITSTEAQTLAQSSHSAVLSLQALSTRSYKSIIASSDHLSNLRTELPSLTVEAKELQNEIPELDRGASRFAATYSKSQENKLLDRRKRAMLLAKNADRLSDILDLPTLLSSAIASSASTPGSSASSSTSNYSSALDLNAHIKRLHLLYPESQLVKSIFDQAEGIMQGMTTNLIMTLRSQGIKLAAGMRTIGWLRRVAPELSDTGSKVATTGEGQDLGLGSLFLVCRLTNLVSMLNALEPLRELADQESEKRLLDRENPKGAGNAWSGGQQTERYLKRYIEIFREQSFGIISMYKSIFPSASSLLVNGDGVSLPPSMQPKSTVPNGIGKEVHDPLRPLPSSLSTFPLHLVDLLMTTLKQYLPNVQDQGSRESLLTQVLYCAGSLGRLGGDFSMMLASLEASDEEEEEEQSEWVEVTKKHRELAGRLELLANGVRDRKSSATLVTDI